jgi:hypothetical protein
MKGPSPAPVLLPCILLAFSFLLAYFYLALVGEVLVNAGPGDQANDGDQGDLESARGETYIHFRREKGPLGQSSDVYYM